LGGEKRVVRGQTNDIMKTPNMLRVLVTTVSIAAFVLAPCPAYSQTTQANPAAPIEKLAAQGGAQSAATPPEEHLKVENGSVFVRRYAGQAWVSDNDATVGGAAKALRDIYPDITFAVDPRVADVPVTDILIRSDQPGTDLEALRTACGGRFDLDTGPIDVVSGRPSSLYRLVCNDLTEQSASKREDRNIECFNLTGYLEQTAKDQEAKQHSHFADGVTVAELQEIIKSTIADFDSAISPPHFQFYPQAQLLIVTGSHRAIEIAAKVIQALPGQPPLMGNMTDFGGYWDSLWKNRAGQPGYPVDAGALSGTARPPKTESVSNAASPFGSTNRK
jgi:hypothetical protein